MDDRRTAHFDADAVIPEGRVVRSDGHVVKGNAVQRSAGVEDADIVLNAAADRGVRDRGIAKQLPHPDRVDAVVCTAMDHDGGRQGGRAGLDDGAVHDQVLARGSRKVTPGAVRSGPP